MARHSEFVEFALEQLSSIGAARARAMFGGFGIYRDDVMFAIIVDDRLYFKADSATRDSFTARGLPPFTYAARGKKISLQYYEAPPEVFEEPETMRTWAERAIGAALNAKRNKESPKKRRANRRP